MGRVLSTIACYDLYAAVIPLDGEFELNTRVTRANDSHKSIVNIGETSRAVEKMVHRVQERWFRGYDTMRGIGGYMLGLN